jgi:hypothetical protein
MNDPSANSSDKGFVPFRAATALARGEEGAGDPAPRVPPPLPPPPPGTPVREVARPVQPVPVVNRPARPPVPRSGASRADVWQVLVAWCVEAGVADGGALADRAGALLETRGELPARDPAFVVRNLCAALAAAREAAGTAPAAAALDLGGCWVTGFPVSGAGGQGLVAAIWGKAALRTPIRVALSAWLAEALARTA